MNIFLLRSSRLKKVQIKISVLYPTSTKSPIYHGLDLYEQNISVARREKMKINLFVWYLHRSISHIHAKPRWRCCFVYVKIFQNRRRQCEWYCCKSDNVFKGFQGNFLHCREANEGANNFCDNVGMWTESFIFFLIFWILIKKNI